MSFSDEPKDFAANAPFRRSCQCGHPMNAHSRWQPTYQKEPIINGCRHIDCPCQKFEEKDAK